VSNKDAIDKMIEKLEPTCSGAAVIKDGGGFDETRAENSDDIPLQTYKRAEL
jgi:hypothetical protein